MKVKVSRKYTSVFRNMAFGGEPNEEVLATEVYYDEKGNVTLEHKHDDSEGKNEKTLFKYNEHGSLIEQEHIMLDEGFSEKFTYERDEKNRVTCYTKFYGDDEGEKVVYTFLEHDSPVTIKRYDDDGELISNEEIKYNDRNHPIAHMTFDEEGKLSGKTEIIYNENELPVEKHIYDQYNELTGTTLIEYNEQKDVIRVIEKNENGKIVSEVISKYDERRNNTERIIKDFHSRKVCFEFDENDNCISEEIYDEHGNLSMKSTYEFDAHNNLISETGYFLDSSRTGMNGNATSRFEYEFWD